MRFTADGVPVVFHDHDLRRMTGARGEVHELDAAAFRALRAGAGAFATLEDVLRLARRHRGGLNVELKNLPGEPGFDPTPAAAERLAAILRRSRVAPFTVQTFWGADLAVLSRLLPGITRSLLVARGAEGHVMERALMAGATAVGLPWPASADSCAASTPTACARWPTRSTSPRPSAPHGTRGWT